MKHISVILILLTVASLLVTGGCGKAPHDTRLEEVSRIVADSPLVAASRLDSINPATLSGGDRHFYDLLTIKARDKVFVTHTSDSLILDVIDYYSSHRSSGLYPEALYYGGRVYSDLGDYPTALKYFQDALDNIPGDNDYLYLKGCITSQTAGLLNQLRLYDQAIPYLEQAVKIDSITNNVFDLAYDHQLLGAILMHQKKYKAADSHFKDALSLSDNLREEDRIFMKVYMAANKYCNGDLDSALIMMRGLPETCRPSSKGVTLSYASSIYLRSGILDTAYMYAYQLANLSSSMNRKSGFQLLLSPEFGNMVPTDSLRKFVAGFRQSMEEYLDHNEATEALIQDSYYNYNKHLCEKEALKKSREHIIYAFFIALLLVLVLCVIILYLKYRNVRQAIKLRDTLNLVSAISVELSEIKSAGSRGDSSVILNTSEDDLRQQLLARLNAIERNNLSVSIPEAILSSELYQTLMAYAKEGKGLQDDNPIWKDMEELILTQSPKFIINLRKLVYGKLSKADLQIALLVRFGISPTGMSVLLNLTPSSVSSRRINISKKIFGRNIGTNVIDFVIRSL